MTDSDAQVLMLKYLRIAVSVLFLLACSLLIGLWVRSFYYYDVVWVPFFNNSRMMIHARDGQFIASAPWRFEGKSHWTIIIQKPVKISDTLARDDRPPFIETLKLWAYREHPIVGFYIPYWFPVFISAALVTAPWIRWQFSVRGLLIAVTIVAVLLGAAVAWLRPQLT